VSNALARQPGIVITSGYYNTDIALEEFSFDVFVNGRYLSLMFSETDPIRRMSGADLNKALTKLVKEKSISQPFAK
jgi:hypothetical protein